jgi:16S rRNA (guanine(527)-N(7))-methyltransferase RsmG
MCISACRALLLSRHSINRLPLAVDTFQSLLASEFARYALLSPDQLSALERHYRLMLHWNRRLNLTRITELDDAVKLHYCESLYLARALPEGTFKIADIGSGAGFPGVPLAIFRPDCSVALIESDQRKAVFLREASRGLLNIEVLASRADEISERFDYAVARAVKREDVLASKLAARFLLLSGEDGTGCRRLPWGEARYLCSIEGPSDPKV